MTEEIAMSQRGTIPPPPSKWGQTDPFYIPTDDDPMTDVSLSSVPPTNEGVILSPPTDPGQKGSNFLALIDENDRQWEGAVELLARWTSSSSQQSSQDRVVLYSHVHHDPIFNGSIVTRSLYRLAQAITFQAPTPPRTTRAERTREFLCALQEAMQRDDYTNVDVVVDDGPLTSWASLQRQLLAEPPDVMILNERKDASAFLAPLWAYVMRSESHHILGTIQNKCAVAITRQEVTSKLAEATRWNYLLCIDAALGPQSQQAIEVCAKLAKPTDAVCVFLTTVLPDVGTALYTEGTQWKALVKEGAERAKRAGIMAKKMYVKRSGCDAALVSVAVRKETFTVGAAFLLGKFDFHVVVVGETLTGKMGAVSRASRKVLGSHAEYFLRHTSVPVVVSAKSMEE